MHAVLKAWNKARWRNQPLTLKALHDEYAKAWADVGDDPVRWEPGEETGEMQTGWRLVETYFRESNIPADSKPEAVEVPVEADLHHHGLPTLIGVLDLVQAGKIIDYKTTGQTPNAEKVAHTNEVQTSGYAVLYREATGKWIRERLLGGNVPDIPITVEAQLIDDPTKTLRERMVKTTDEYCWQCHEKMNPLGLAFENFDHFGRWRDAENGKPVDASGAINKSGDPKLDAPVRDSLELVRRLAASDHVRQVFVRHVFRYFLGRNETLEDAGVLQGADRAYVTSGGSFKALIASLLTSDAFLYRKGAGKHAAR